MMFRKLRGKRLKILLQNNLPLVSFASRALLPLLTLVFILKSLKKQTLANESQKIKRGK